MELLLLANSTIGILFEPLPTHLSQKGAAEDWRGVGVRGGWGGGGSESEAFRSAQTQKELVIIS